MTKLTLFLQFEGDPRVELAEFDEKAGTKDVRAKAVELGFANLSDASVFAEGGADSLDDKQPLTAQGVSNKQRLCLHRCKKIHVTVDFAGDSKQHPFPPAVTIAEVKAWFVDKIGMSAADATEHVLQISGTKERPSPDTMIGSLKSVDCRIEVSLVPLKRVEG
jgi:hypothetical protein